MIPIRRIVGLLRFALLVVAAWPVAVATAQDGDRQLSNAWSPYEPYSYVETDRGFSIWTGLDVELLRVIGERAGYHIESEDIPWDEHVHRIEIGETDLATSATWTPEREEFAHFSAPYRKETMALILPRGAGGELPAETDEELVARFKETGFRLGVQDGIAFPSAAIEAFLADPGNSGQIVVVQQQQDLLRNLLAGHIDGFPADRIGAATIVWMNGQQDAVEEHPLLVERDVHLMFSKASVSPEVVADFNEAIRSIRDDGTFNRINLDYMFPILLAQTLDTRWFLIIDIGGTIAFALSGLLIAYKYDYDIFGALVLASLPAVGGGIARDLLTNRETVGVLSNSIYIIIIMMLVIVGFLVLRLGTEIKRDRPDSRLLAVFGRFRDHGNFLIKLFDAIGLGAFTVTGVVVALGTHSQPLWLWGPLLAALTSSGGGILRDVLRSDPEIPALRGELYPEIAFVWGGILSAYLIWQTHHLDPDQILLGIVVTVIGTIATRMAVIHFGIRSPRFHSHRSDPPVKDSGGVV